MFSPIEFQGQKRNSTDAGVQTEPVAVAPAAEKSKWNQNQHWSFPCTDAPVSLPCSYSIFISLSSPPFSTLTTFFLFVALQMKRQVPGRKKKQVNSCETDEQWAGSWISGELKRSKASLLRYVYFWSYKCLDKYISVKPFLQTFNVTSLCSCNLTYWAYAIDSAMLCF